MRIVVLTGVFAITSVALACSAYAQAAPPHTRTGLSVEQLVEVALEANPQVRAARARWMAAEHSIKQTLVPNDPVFTYSNVDSPTNGFDRAAVHSLNVSEAFQFPGKAFLQHNVAQRTAQIAELTYRATARDIRAATETAYYQLVLDSALTRANQENVDNLTRVLKVAQVAYAGSQVTQTDLISAEFDLAAAQQAQLQFRTGVANDVTELDQLLDRGPEEPLEVNRTLKLARLSIPVETLVDRAEQARQEILELAATERNSATALKLAELEYAPDFTVGYTFDHYLIAPFAPTPSATQDHGFQVGFNMPVFFWVRQAEDVKQARDSLLAARDDLASIRSQTAATVTTLYRTAQLSYRTALLYRDSLIPLAHQGFSVALIAYQSGKIDFVTLSGALQRSYSARVAYLQAANQFLAGRVALEQAIGAPLPQ